MIVLAIDASGPNCAVWLGRVGPAAGEITELYEQSERIGRGHAERLLPMVEEALRAAHLGFPDLGRIAVATGPGSFTGVRVGVAAARGLALALGIEAVGVGSLEALAAEGRTLVDNATLVAVLAAPRGELFAYAADRDGAVRLEPSVIEAAELAHIVVGWGSGPVAVIGSGAPSLAGEIDRSGVRVRVLREAESPQPCWIARLALDGAGMVPPRPVYLRPPDAKPQANKALRRAG